MHLEKYFYVMLKKDEALKNFCFEDDGRGRPRSDETLENIQIFTRNPKNIGKHSILYLEPKRTLESLFYLGSSEPTNRTNIP